MEKILRRMFNDPMLPFNNSPEQLSAVKMLVGESEEIWDKLEKRLSPEEYSLLNEYADKSNEILSECEYIAFCSGIRYFARLFAEIFSGQ